MNTSTFEDIAVDWEDYYWLGIIRSTVFDELPLDEVQIQINTDGTSKAIHLNQIKEWKGFIADPMNSVKILKSIFHYYNKIRPQYEKAGPEWIKNMPIIKTENEIKKMIRMNSITISDPTENQIEIGFNFSCDWDREHGLGVVFSKTKVIEVGGADCAIL